MDEVAYQTKIYGVDNNELKSQIQKWVDSQPQIEGWNTVLSVSSTWQFGLSDDALLDSEAKCESSTSQMSGSSNDDSLEISVPTIVLSAALGIVLILLVLMLIVTCATVKWYRKKHKETTVDTRYVVT